MKQSSVKQSTCQLITGLITQEGDFHFLIGCDTGTRTHRWRQCSTRRVHSATHATLGGIGYIMGFYVNVYYV